MNTEAAAVSMGDHVQVDTVLDGLQKFEIDHQSHTGEGLVSHLKGTYQILADWGCEEPLCFGGLCHSVYGTESYRQQTVQLSDREVIRELIGERAEYLAYLFGAHDKTSLWENLDRDAKAYAIRDRFAEKVILLSEADFRDLVTLTLANWLEQRPRAAEKYQFLRQTEFLASESLLPELGYKAFRKAYGL